MLQPARTKYRKMQKGRIKGFAQKGNQLEFGSFGIKSLQKSFVTSKQIEAARQALTRFLKREGMVWIRIFPDKPISKKPLETRMGKGKGEPEYYVARVEPGRILFEIDGISLAEATKALNLAAQKLPVTTKLVVRRDYTESQ